MVGKRKWNNNENKDNFFFYYIYGLKNKKHHTIIDVILFISKSILMMSRRLQHTVLITGNYARIFQLTGRGNIFAKLSTSLLIYKNTFRQMLMIISFVASENFKREL